MKIDVRALGYSFALLWGGAVFITGKCKSDLADLWHWISGSACFRLSRIPRHSFIWPGPCGNLQRPRGRFRGLALQSLCEIEIGRLRGRRSTKR